MSKLFSLLLFSGILSGLAAAEITTTMPALTTKRAYLPRKESGYTFVGNIEQTAYAAFQTPSCIHFQPVNPSHNPELYIALPPELELLKVFRGIALEQTGKWRHDGREFDLYRAVPGNGASKYTFLWELKRQLPAGTRLTGYYWGKWSKGEQPPQKLDIAVVDIPRVKAFRKIPVWWSMPGDFFAMLPEMKHLKAAGFNFIDIWVYLNPEETAWGEANLNAIRPLAQAAGLGEMGWIQEWWWHRGQKTPEGMATMADGSKSDSQLCLSYRGEWYQNLLQQGRLLIDRGIYCHVTDPEMYSQGDRLCCCDRCEKAFREYLRKNRPDATFDNLRDLANRPEENPAAAALWREFKCRQYAAFFADYRKTMEQYMRSRQLDPAQFRFMIYSTYHRAYPGFYDFADYRESKIYTHALEDPALLAEVFDFIAPMSYTEVFANYQPYDMLTTRKDVLALRKIMNDRVAVAPILSTGYPYTYAFDCDLNAAMLKCAILEAIAAGARGFGFWGECPLDANDLRVIAETVGMLSPYEELLLTARPDDTQVQADTAMARCLASPHGKIVLISEYSDRPLTVRVKVQGSDTATVRDLHTGEIAGKLTPEIREFTIKLDQERAKLFHIGKD